MVVSCPRDDHSEQSTIAFMGERSYNLVRTRELGFLTVVLSQDFSNALQQQLV